MPEFSSLENRTLSRIWESFVIDGTLVSPRKVVVFRPSLKFKHRVTHPDDLPRRPSKQMDLFEG